MNPVLFRVEVRHCKLRTLRERRRRKRRKSGCQRDQRKL